MRPAPVRGARESGDAVLDRFTEPATVPERPDRSDAGFSLVELIFAMGIFSILLGIFAVTIVNFSSATLKTVTRSDQGTQARTVLDLFDRQVRSASAINRPVLVGTLWYVEFRTDSISPSSCTQYVLRTGSSTLATRSWTTGLSTTPVPSSWRSLASDVVNTTAQQPFTFTPGTTISPLQQLTVNLRFRLGSGSATVGADTFAAANTSTATATNPDTNNDGVSDVQVCQDITDPRPAS